jgi:hypothetical protein
MEDTTDDITFPDMDTWRGSGNRFGLTFKQIIIQHINRCVVNGSEEWRGGYWEEKIMPNGNIQRKYHPDTRETYNNSIKMLRAILLSYYDDEMDKIDEEIKLKLNPLEGKMITPELNLKKIALHIRLFEELVKLCKRFNFFEEEEVVDTI